MARLKIDEVRRLLVPLETAVDAMLELDHIHAGPLSQGRLQGARLIGVEEGDPGLLVVVQEPGLDAPAPASYRYNLKEVAAALLNYCIQSRIPLPRVAEKRIEIVPEGFVLTLQSSASMVRRHGALPEAPAVRAQVHPVLGRRLQSETTGQSQVVAVP